MEDDWLRARWLDPKARDSLRRCFANQADRDAAAERLLHEQAERAADLADPSTWLSIDAETRGGAPACSEARSVGLGLQTRRLGLPAVGGVGR